MSQLNATTVIHVVCWPTFTGIPDLSDVSMSFQPFLSAYLSIYHCFFTTFQIAYFLLAFCYTLLFVPLLFCSAATSMVDCYLLVLLVCSAMDYKSTVISHLFTVTCIAVFLLTIDQI